MLLHQERRRSKLLISTSVKWIFLSRDSLPLHRVLIAFHWRAKLMSKTLVPFFAKMRVPDFFLMPSRWSLCLTAIRDFSICFGKMQLLFLLLVAFFATTKSTVTKVPIRHTQIDIHPSFTYIVNHPTHQIGLGVSASNLLQCIYLCQNHDYCRTAIFDRQAMICLLFEECSSFGDIVPHAARTVISFQLCANEPESMVFSPPVPVPIPVSTMMSNLTLITHLAASASWFPFFVVSEIYVPRQRSIDVYATDSYQLVRTIPIPVKSSFSFIRGDSQGTIIYNQPSDSNIYIYSLQTKILSTVNSSLTNFFICFSTSFIIITSSPLGAADVYRRSLANNSATFLYRIGGWNYIRHCAILKDETLVASLAFGGLQTTILSKTTFNSTVVTLALNASYLPTGAALNFDPAGRLYTSTIASQNMSLVYLSDGRLIGTHQGTLDSAGKASKYKFMLLFTDGDKVSVYESQSPN